MRDQPSLFALDCAPQDLRLVAGFPPERPVDLTPGFETSAVVHSTAEMVAEFHRAFGLPVRDRPTLDVDEREIALRSRLLAEEIRELTNGCIARSLVGVADGLADVVYVVYGTALTFGIDLDRVVAEVHRANMSKLDEHGNPTMRDDGKVLKGPNYSPPDIAAVLEATAAQAQSSPQTPNIAQPDGAHPPQAHNHCVS